MQAGRQTQLHRAPQPGGIHAAPLPTSGKLPIPLADGRTFTLDLDELPLPDPEADTR
ncbi:hypothetical protein [Streptomyces sp. P17]|uniref:hypothetical protein n=1 Tax=Streptomyces sp. P17 TaxID=3074716 RepID=UPI0028F42C29|nr:hypothetical protein [Streptomyces sp. P17]MDT9697314.1 hypothetical protein [Streptomyces sp. P17]